MPIVKTLPKDEPLMIASPIDQAAHRHAPVVIGAIGGSGTRILSQILSAAGIGMGSSVDPATWDSLPVREYLASEFQHLAIGCLSNRVDLSAETKTKFLAALERHRESIEPGLRWGWKNPRNMWLIPFYQHFFPGMFFILLVRDGRDLAMSSNTFLLRSAGEFLLEGHDYASHDVAQLALWEKGTRFAMESGQSLLANRFVVIRYEDLCMQPVSTLEHLFDSLHIDYTREFLINSSEAIKPSMGIGRGANIAMDQIPLSTQSLLRSLRYSA